MEILEVTPAERQAIALLEERRGLLERAHLPAQIAAVSNAMINALRAGGCIYWMGNGGSAADAQHLAAEFSGRFRRERPGWHSIAISTNTSALTAIGNDYGYEHVFSRQLEGSVRPVDVVVGISTSGNSPNVVLGLEKAKERGATTVAMTGNGGGRIAELADLVLLGPDGYAALVQEVHITVGHIVCDIVEAELAR